MDSFSREKEARDAAEKLQASVSEELKRSQQDNSSANQKVRRCTRYCFGLIIVVNCLVGFTSCLYLQIQSLNEMYKRLQEYNTSLQQYNSKLQSELASTNETLKRVEKEKAAVFENLSTLRGHYTSLQEQLSSSRVSFRFSCWFLVSCC